MDPEAAFAELLDAVGHREWNRVDECSRELLDWMERGGFPPVTVGNGTLGVEWHRAVATFVCYLAQSKVRDARKCRERKRGA